MPPKKQSFFHTHNTFILRFLFVASLLGSAAICGFVSYRVVDNLERSVGLQTYESIAQSALQNAQSITVRKVQGGQVLASVMGHAFPSSEQWPFVALDGYIETASRIAALTQSLTMAVNVFVDPDQIEEFNAHAEETYRQQGYPETAGYDEEAGFGVWKRDKDRNRVLDTTGETPYNHTHDFLVPIFLHNNPNAGSILFNVHSTLFLGQALDSMLDCAAQKNELDDDCVVVSDFFELIVAPGPAALLYVPVYARGDQKIVAVAASSINWAEVLTNIVPDYVDGLHCVVSTDTESYTYVINQGVPQLVGEGDLHDDHFDGSAHSVVLNDFETGALASKTYTLTVYPTNQMLDEFRTNSPVVIAMGFVAVLLICALIFAAYDWLMRGESRQQKAILQVKRRFVRFVSHEIRTPLNTCCLGLELLLAELESLQQKQSSSIQATHNLLQSGPPTIDSKISKQLSAPFQSLMDLTSDILDNSESAVTILNDLLNYDKIETGTFQLEVSIVPIWEVVRKTVSAFDIQARKRNVQLKFELLENLKDNLNGKNEDATANQLENGKAKPDLSSFNVVGDDMRLRQVILNIVSNALKFVEEGTGEIHVTASYLPDGLPGFRPLLTNKDGLANSQPEPIAYPRQGAIAISVRDNGAGMSHEQLQLLFREGVQFDANKLQAGGGSGLGMYITKGLIEQHGGSIQVESQGQGHGTTFTVLLPLYLCHSDQTSSTTDTLLSTNAAPTAGAGVAPSTTAPEAATNPGVTQQRRILVVDDAAMNRKLLIRLLERAGHSCNSAADGQEAVDAIVADQGLAAADDNHTEYDTILMDFEMPVLNGPDATAVIRSKGCNAFIVGVTGNVLLEDVNHFKSKGADLVLAKPLKVAALEEAWRSKSGLNRSRSGGQL